MTRKRSTESPDITMKISVEQFIQTIETKFSGKIQKLNLDKKTFSQIQSALKSTFTETISRKSAKSGKIEINQLPLNSLAASGKFKDKDQGEIVYVPGTPHHKPYIRKWVIPPNPQTSTQQSHRSIFKQVSQQWANESDAIKALWNKKVSPNIPLTGQNLYIKKWFQIGKKTGHYPGIGFKP